MSKSSSIQTTVLARVIGLMPGRRALMLAGVSALALMATTPRLEARQLGSAAPVSAPALALAAAQAAAMQSSQQASAAIKRAGQAVRDIQLMQQQARAAAGFNPIPNGLSVGGLQPDSGLSGAGRANEVASWTNALTPVQSDIGGRTTVDIQQTQPKAILTWKTFNVGSNTTVNFRQQDYLGIHTDWVALNRIDDPSGRPSQILGQINAPGSVYLINRNGIIFGAGSQVNVTGLVASSIDVGSLGMTRGQRDQFFLNNGIASSGSFSISSTPDGGDAATTVVGGEIRVDAGASITSALNAQDSPGFVYLFGSNVTNNGSITSPAGEVAMVAGRTLSLTPGSYRPGILPKDPLTPANDVTFRGTGINFSQYSSNSSYSATGVPTNSFALTGTGTVTQGGMVATPRGTALLTGDRVVMSGVISADTSVTRNSSVLLDAVTSVNVSGTISIQPFENGESLPFLNGAATQGTPSIVQAFIPGFILASAYDVTIASSGLVSAPSATVKLRAVDVSNATDALAGELNANKRATVDTSSVPQRVLLAPGATVDVAGLQNVELPVSSNFIAYQPRGTEFADTPLLRNGVLVGKTLYVDVRQSGTRSDGTTWLGTPLGNANGYVNNAPQTLDVLMTKGGSVSIDTGSNTSTAKDVVLQPGSLINLAGGSVNYIGGQVPVTILIGADGRRYSMTNADPNMTYIAVGSPFTVNHAHWGVTETYSFGPTSSFESGYVEGRDAGGISIATNNAVLGGDLLFGSVIGDRQIAKGKKASTTLTNGAPSQATPYEMPSQGYLSLATSNAIVIGGSNTVLPADFTATTLLKANAFDPIPTDLYKTQASYRTDLSAAQLSGYHLSALMITASDLTLTRGSDLEVALGGSVTFKTASAMDIQGGITAHSGQIAIATDGYDLTTNFSQAGTFKISSTPSGSASIADIRVGGALDTTGLWVNDTGITTSGLATGKAFIDGGSISIQSNSFAGPDNKDATGSIILAATSVLDASSGGYVGSNGKIATSAYQVPAGKGGNIALFTYQGAPFVNLQTGGNGPLLQVDDPNAVNPPRLASIYIDATAVVRSYGFTTNGEFSITAPRSVQIGGPSKSSGTQLWLPESFINAGGFSKYTIQAISDGHLVSTINGPQPTAAASVTVATGAAVNLRQRNFTLSGLALGDLPTDTDIGAVASVVTLPDDQRLATGLALGSDNILLNSGSRIVTDAGASVSLSGSLSGTATSTLLLGQIVNHGGNVTVASQRIWLGPQALIDVSGTFIASSTFDPGPGRAQGSPTVSGRLLDGGNVTFSPTGYQGNYLIGQSGAKIDLSGARASLLGIGSKDPIDSWSDGGTLSIQTQTLLWDGSFAAKAGAPQGNGGTLILGGGQVVLAQSAASTLGGDLSAALAAVSTPKSAADLGKTVVPSLTPFVPGFGGNGNIHVAVDKLSTFANIFLYSGVQSATDFFSMLDPASRGSVVVRAAVPLQLVGNIDWTVSQRLYLGAGAIAANAPGTTSSVNITSPYVLLTTYGKNTATAAAGSGTLTINGDTIDVESAVFSGFSSVRLNSTGDIRLSTPRVVEGVLAGNLNPATFTGRIETPGDLLLQAQRIYPVTNVDFTIKAASVILTAPAGSNTRTPLSAGGSVTVQANTIAQNGNLFAPLGAITLGDATTQSVTLGAGGLTSVSLNDTIVPFGAMQDGINWFYNDNTSPLTVALATATSFLPTKTITLNGQNIRLQSTSTVDVSGGGDVQAIEFINGKGGTVDTLARKSSGMPVYALLPSNSDAVAAFDIDFIYRLGDSQPLAGQQVYLAGGNGIAAGTYTLLPAHYATLPGALRVVDYNSSALAKPGFAGLTLRDGTQIIGGYYTQSTLPGGRSSGTELFAVQTNDVWRQYSEITSSLANSYFYAKSVHDGVNVPYLPVDAGRLAISAQNSLVMLETARTRAAEMGRPGQLDLSANQIALVAPGQVAPGGYLGIDVTQINGFGSVLIGGLRADRADGTTVINAVASNLLVDTRGVELAAPEIILVATPSVSTTTLAQVFTVRSNTGFGAPVNVPFTLPGAMSGTADAGSGNIVVAADSVLHATGLTGNTYARKYVTSSVTAADLAAALGGVLSDDGTTITAANLSLLQNSDPTVLALLRSYGGSRQFGAMMTLTSDPLLSVGDLSGSDNAALVISFITGTGVTSTVYGTLALPGSNGNNTGTITIAANADVRGKSVTLNATKSTAAIAIDPNAQFDAARINLIAKNFGLGAAPAATTAVALTAQTFDRLADGRVLSLQASSGGIDFYGDVALGNARQSLGVTLDASYLAGHGGNVSIGTGGVLTLLNSGSSGATSQTAFTNSSIVLNADEIDLGGGTQTIAGFGAVVMAADSRVFARNSGLLQLGLNGRDVNGNFTDPAVVNLNMTTPNLLVGAATSSGVGTGSQFVIGTRGDVVVARPGGAVAEPDVTTENGGSLEIDASSLVLAGTIQAQAGTVLVHTSGSGGITLTDSARIAAGGFKQSFFDVDRFLPGGKVTLTADLGTVFTAPKSVIDVAQPVDDKGTIGLGYGGEFDVIAAAGAAELTGTIKGAGAAGHGGTFHLDALTLGSLDLLADKLLSGGVSGEIAVRTRQGDMILSQDHTLRAHTVTLVADAPTTSATVIGDPGNLIIAGIIDARGEDSATLDGTNQAGGQVGLWGANSVRLTPTALIQASTNPATHPDERGGDVVIGVGWNSGWNPASKTGGINLEAGSRIDVSGGSKGGLNGGTVKLRAPNDGLGDVKIQQVRSTIAGARAVTIEDYVSFDTVAGNNGINASGLGWDGIIDPAGWYNSSGKLVNGSFSGLSGWKLTVTPGSGYTSVPLLTFTNPVPTIAVSLKLVSLTLTTGKSGEYSSIPTVTFAAPNNPGWPNNGTSAQVSVNVGLVTIAVANGPTGVTNGASVTIAGGGGTGATGTAIVTGGVLTGVRIVGAGVNFTGAPTSLTVSGGPTVTTGISATYRINSVAVTNAGDGYVSVPAFTISGGNTITAAAFNAPSMGLSVTALDASNYVIPAFTINSSGTGGTGGNITVAALSALTGTGTVSNGVFTATGAAGFTLLDSNRTDTGRGTATFTPTALNALHTGFYQTVLANYSNGSGFTSGGKTYTFGGAQARLGDYVQPDGNGGTTSVATHVQPGIDLINSSSTVNSGDITVASNWNLAAGTAYKTNAMGVGVALTSTDTFSFANNYVDFIYRLGLEPGTLSLRAARDVTIGASISDGFFQFFNYNATAYITALRNYSGKLALGNDASLNGILSVTPPTYLQTSNNVSPPGSALAAADVFPDTLLICTANCTTAAPDTRAVPNAGSWSYRVTSGADFSSADPTTNRSLATFGDGGTTSNRGRGNITFTGHDSYLQAVSAANATTLVNLPTMLRTGTGNIDIAAARNLEMKDQLAPGVIYTAGVDTSLPAALADPQWVIQGSTSPNPLLVANNPLAFVEPQMLLQSAGGLYAVFGPPNAAAFPQMGGDITIAAQQDVIGFQNVKNPAQSATQFVQIYTPWLLAVGSTASAANITLGAGAFTPISANMVRQTAWWIQFGSFDQGVMSVGGNVTLDVGRDLRDFSVSLPTTGRVSGGLSQAFNGQLNTPVPHVYGSGNMAVNVGRSLLSGSYYEGSGNASIVVRGSVGSDWQTSATSSSTGSVFVSPANTVLALDSGSIALTAGGSIALGTSLQFITSMTGSAVRPPTFAAIVNPAMLRRLSFGVQTYGPDSLVRLAAGSGDITLGNPAENTINPTNLALAVPYPASLEATAFTGAINLNDYAVLFDSVKGSFDLLAGRNILLTASVSTGASLIDTAFNAYTPNNGFDGATSKVLLAQADHPGANHVYALGGDIETTTNTLNGLGPRLLSNRSIAIRASNDIIDFNVVAQNVNFDDVSSVIAGRDISFTGLNNLGGIQIAGPGFLTVEAGRDLGPFLPLAKDTASLAKVPEGIQSVGNNRVLQGTAAAPVGNGPDAQSFAPPNPEFIGVRNFLLPDTGASIVAMFGVAKGVNYQAVINAYVDPASIVAVPHNYLDELQAFLARIGKTSVDRADAWTKFKGLSPQLQQIFATQVFFTELKATGIPDTPSYKQFQRGYAAVNLMFPADVSADGLYGYTRNDLGGGSNGANALVATGNLEMLHGTIQTQKGGDISILGPGGSLIVGSVAPEPNSNLKLSNLGLLTLAGGAINTFTDQDVLVNASRVMTWYGGDILMWSSNGDIDAGRGAKTTLSFPPLKVNFNQDDIQTVDLGALVSGAGIAVLQTQSFAVKSNAYLLAPRGTVDAGDAGIRVSGDLSILAVRVNNADNISVGGKSNGVPTVEAPNIGALTSANNTAGAATRTAAPGGDKPTGQPSVIIVEILGYGGGTGGADVGSPQSETPQSPTPKPTDDRQSYNPNGNVRVLGYSTLGESEMIGLTEQEKNAIRN